MDINYQKLKKIINKKSSQNEIAKRLDMHITTLNRKLNQHLSFTVEELLKLIKSLEIDLEEIVLLDEVEITFLEKVG